MKSRDVGILKIGIVSAGGDDMKSTWESLENDEDTRKPFIGPDGITRFAHLTPVTFDKLFVLAGIAVSQVLKEHDARPDVICLGSSSDTYSGRELGRFPDPIVHRLANCFMIPKRYQFSSACTSSSVAIDVAMEMIRTGQSKLALVGGVDEVTYSSIVGFESCRLYTDKARPFAKDRDGMILADGAAFLLLAPRGVGEPLAYLTGSGVGSDAFHMVSMLEDGVNQVMKESLKDAGISKVDAIFAHGVGTNRNDLVESNAIDLQTPPFQRRPAVVSYKRVLGHPQGTSGVFGVALAVESMRRKRIFATTKKEDLDLTLRVADAVVTENRVADFKNIMCLAHGTWGAYSSLIISEA